MKTIFPPTAPLPRLCPSLARLLAGRRAPFSRDHKTKGDTLTKLLIGLLSLIGGVLDHHGGDPDRGDDDLRHNDGPHHCGNVNRGS